MTYNTYQIDSILRKLFLILVKLDHRPKIKFNGKNLYQSDSVKYLAIRLDKYIT